MSTTSWIYLINRKSHSTSSSSVESAYDMPDTRAHNASKDAQRMTPTPRRLHTIRTSTHRASNALNVKRSTLVALANRKRATKNKLQTRLKTCRNPTELTPLSLERRLREGLANIHHMGLGTTARWGKEQVTQ